MSDHKIRIAVWSLDSEHGWCRLIERALRFFGGVPRFIVYSSSVQSHVKQCVREPAHNSMLASTISHYRFKLGELPCTEPVHQGDTSAEGNCHGADGLQGLPSAGLRFESLEQQNTYWLRRSTHWVGRSLGLRSRAQVSRAFERERQNLLPVPALGVQYFTEITRLVCDDGCIRVHNSSYMASPAAIGSRVRVRVFSQKLEIYPIVDCVDLVVHRNQDETDKYRTGRAGNATTLATTNTSKSSSENCGKKSMTTSVTAGGAADMCTQSRPIRTHWRQDAIRAGRSQVFARSDERLMSISLQTEQILHLAQRIGPHVQQWCDRVFKEQGRLAHRTMWAVLSLSSRVGAQHVDSACARGLAQGVITYQHVKSLATQMHRLHEQAAQDRLQLKLDWS